MRAMTETVDFSHIRPVDMERLRAAGDSRYVQRLLDETSGGSSCRISYIKTPPESGSPEGPHTHEVDQIFFVLAGTMTIEVDGHQSEVGPGNLVVFPAGVRHRNFNAGSEPTIHLSIAVPMPDANAPFASHVPDQP
jgi:mannose-6-phosphate isomerase-like protein (cupin superfamily)